VAGGGQAREVSVEINGNSVGLQGGADRIRQGSAGELQATYVEVLQVKYGFLGWPLDR
jgi:hypothetical protein